MVALFFFFAKQESENLIFLIMKLFCLSLSSVYNLFHFVSSLPRNIFFLSLLLILQNLIREFEGIHIIAGFLSDPAADVRVQTLTALNNLCMNIPNQEQLKVHTSM